MAKMKTPARGGRAHQSMAGAIDPSPARPPKPAAAAAPPSKPPKPLGPPDMAAGAPKGGKRKAGC